MSNLLSKLWPVLLAVYIISPFDAHPLFLDDLIAAGIMFYMIYKNSKRRQQYEQYYTHTGSADNGRSRTSHPSAPMSLDEAYKILDIKSGASLDDISKAYREKMKKSHPDKVSHLSHELQEKAKELTLRINEAFELIKNNKK
ncbi:MAG: DnaJ domain-containing protein [Nitrospiraceae bacterium]|nr:MAG: DnaJ domain-containing protein [Nitrospiraceae bacterium]